MVARNLQLPRKYYKRVRPPPAIRLTQDRRFQATLVANLTGTGIGAIEGRIAGKAQLRNILLQGMAENIVNEMRAFHINTTMEAWRMARADGDLDQEVAILVDGSPGRPIKNVKFAGRIDILSPPNVEDLIAAAKLVWVLMIKTAAALPRTTPQAEYLQKKTWKGQYSKSFSMWVSEKTEIVNITDLDKEGVVTADDFITIHNEVPYAAKLTRQHYPVGPFVQAFKQLRKSKFGKNLAIRFDFIASTLTTMKQSGGTPTPQPVLRIGMPGAFPSRMANVKKSIRRNQKAGRKY